MFRGRSWAASGGRWWAVIVYVIVGAAVAGLPDPANAADAEIRWRATHLLGVSRATANGVGSPDQLSFNQLSFYVRGGAVPARVAERLEHRGNPADLANQIVVATDRASGSLRISSIQLDGDRAVELADAFAEELTAYLQERELERQDGRLAAGLDRLEGLEESLRDAEARSLRDPSDAVALAEFQSLRSQYSVVFEQVVLLGSEPTGLVLTTLESAQPIVVADAGLTAPRSRLGRALSGAAAGLALGIGIAVLLTRAERRIRSVTEVEELVGAAVPVVVPDRNRSDMNSLFVTRDRHDLAAESYRTLARVAMLSHRSRHDDGSAPIMVVTSPGRRDGRTNVTAEIGAALAEIHAGSFVVNADFRRPTVGSRLARNTPRASGLLGPEGLDNAPPELLIHPTDLAGLSLVDLAGTPRLGPGDLARATASLITSLRHQASAVVVDTPAVTTAAESLEIISCADVVLLVIRINHTQKAAATRTIELVRSVSDAVVIPVVTGGRGLSPMYESYTAPVAAGGSSAAART